MTVLAASIKSPQVTLETAFIVGAWVASVGFMFIWLAWKMRKEARGT